MEDVSDIEDLDDDGKPEIEVIDLEVEEVSSLFLCTAGYFVVHRIKLQKHFHLEFWVKCVSSPW